MKINRRDLIKGGVVVPFVIQPMFRVVLADHKIVIPQNDIMSVSLFVAHNESGMGFQSRHFLSLVRGHKIVMQNVNGELHVDLVKGE